LTAAAAATKRQNPAAAKLEMRRIVLGPSLDSANPAIDHYLGPVNIASAQVCRHPPQKQKTRVRIPPGFKVF
jgi:hypothetical protein